jgi:hypothetical protein
MLMPRDGYRAQWQSGRVRPEHLQAAIAAAGARCTVDELLAGLDGQPMLPPRLPLATDLVDEQRDVGHAVAWRDYITQHVSQHCAAYFDQGQAALGPDGSEGLYASWRQQAVHDLGPAMLMAYPGFSARVAALPADALALIAAARQALQLPAAATESYFSALLMSINAGLVVRLPALAGAYCNTTTRRSCSCWPCVWPGNGCCTAAIPRSAWRPAGQGLERLRPRDCKRPACARDRLAVAGGARTQRPGAAVPWSGTGTGCG